MMSNDSGTDTTAEFEGAVATAPARARYTENHAGGDLPSTFLACRAPSRRNPERFVCGAKLGEALEDLRFMGAVRRWADRNRATDAPRDVRRCPKCGWYNLYEPASR